MADCLEVGSGVSATPRYGAVLAWASGVGELASAKEQFDRDLRESHEVFSDWHEQRLADVFDAARREGFTVEIEHGDVPTVGQGPMFYFANSNRIHRSYTIITASRNDVIETLREMGAALHGL